MSLALLALTDNEPKSDISMDFDNIRILVPRDTTGREAEGGGTLFCLFIPIYILYYNNIL